MCLYLAEESFDSGLRQQQCRRCCFSCIINRDNDNASVAPVRTGFDVPKCL